MIGCKLLMKLRSDYLMIFCSGGENPGMENTNPNSIQVGLQVSFKCVPDPSSDANMDPDFYEKNINQFIYLLRFKEFIYLCPVNFNAAGSGSPFIGHFSPSCPFVSRSTVILTIHLKM